MDKEAYINRAIECLEAAERAETDADHRKWLQEALTYRELATIAAYRLSGEIGDQSPPTSPDLTDLS